MSTDGGSIDPRLVDRMLSSMGARCDHRHVYHVSSTVVLASGGPIDGPTASSDISSETWVVGDVRLDNTAHLAAQLRCPEYDDAVLGHAHLQWLDCCAEHLHGDFAFAVWDKARRRLFLARDRFGVRPLVYTFGEGWFAFASEVKALLTLPDLVKESSELRIADFLAGRSPQAQTTNFNNIHRLPAGFRMSVGEDGTEIAPYFSWELPPLAKAPELSATLRDTFSQAVRRRAGESKPEAVLLSGGLDSSSIAATLARERSGHDAPVATYSIVFDKYPEQSERRFIEALLNTGSYEPHFLDLDVEDPFLDFADLLARQDGLFLTPGLAMGRGLLANLARGTVVLDGHGGDEVISDGYERLHELAEQEKWFRFWIEALGACRVTGSSPLKISAGYYAKYGRGGWRLKRLLKGFAGPSSQYDRRSDMLLSSRLQNRLEPLKPAPTAPPGQNEGRVRHLSILADPGQQHVLEVLDRDAVERGLEVRFPFWDEDLIAFMLSVPAKEKLRGGRTRHILRQAMKDRLPDLICWRRDKHNFNHHLVRGLMMSPATAPERFERDGERLARYMNMRVVEEARDRLFSDPSRAEGSDIHVLWRATAVAEWLDYADRNGIRIVE